MGWFGRMVPVKNIALLAATIESTLQSQTGHTVCDRGRWAGARRAERRSRTLSASAWNGWVGKRRLLPAMARCDVLLQTSRNEGTPVALIQGMAAARPFVSTAVGGVVDMVSGTAKSRRRRRALVCQRRARESRCRTRWLERWARWRTTGRR